MLSCCSVIVPGTSSYVILLFSYCVLLSALWPCSGLLFSSESYAEVSYSQVSCSFALFCEPVLMSCSQVSCFQLPFRVPRSGPCSDACYCVMLWCTIQIHRSVVLFCALLSALF